MGFLAEFCQGFVTGRRQGQLRDAVMTVARRMNFDVHQGPKGIPVVFLTGGADYCASFTVTDDGTMFAMMMGVFKWKRRPPREVYEMIEYLESKSNFASFTVLDGNSDGEWRTAAMTKIRTLDTLKEEEFWLRLAGIGKLMVKADETVLDNRWF